MSWEREIMERIYSGLPSDVIDPENDDWTNLEDSVDELENSRDKYRMLWQEQRNELLAIRRVLREFADYYDETPGASIEESLRKLLKNLEFLGWNK